MVTMVNTVKTTMSTPLVTVAGTVSMVKTAEDMKVEADTEMVTVASSGRNVVPAV